MDGVGKKRKAELTIERLSSNGVSGILYRKNRNYYEIRFKEGGKDIYLGSSADYFEACCIRKSFNNKRVKELLNTYF